MKEPNYTKLVEYRRNGLAEQTHFGIIIHMNKKGIISKAGDDNNYKFYHRSCMKPLQAAPLIDLNLHTKNNLTEQEIALCCASHAGDIEHQKTVLSILKKAGLDDSYLLCKPHEPLSIKERDRLIKNNLKYSSLHHNCSGKHASMLSICREKGFPTENYKDFENPLSDFILKRVCELCGVKKDEVIISKDGCGLPVIATTLEELGFGFLNLFTNPKYEIIKNAFINNPFLIGGTKRLDTDIISADTDNILVAKVGACGLCVVVNTKKEECIVVKIADSNMEARAIATIEALKQLKWTNNSDEFSDRLSKIYSKNIFSDDGELLGEIIPTFKLN